MLLDKYLNVKKKVKKNLNVKRQSLQGEKFCPFLE